MEERKKVKYKILVLEDGESVVLGPANEPLKMASPKEQGCKVSIESIIECDLGNPKIVCVGGRCWYVP